MPGGLFLFDVNTPEKLEGLDGQVFLDETEDTYCVWRAEWSRRGRTCSYFMDLFRREENGLWRREEELHRERAYPVPELTAMLERAGFSDIRTYAAFQFRPPAPGRSGYSSPRERTIEPPMPDEITRAITGDGLVKAVAVTGRDLVEGPDHPHPPAHGHRRPGPGPAGGPP